MGEDKNVTGNSEIIERENSREAILKGSAEFSKFLVDKYPQLDQEGKLNYFIAGSLATTLLLQTNKIQYLDPQQMPAIKVTEEEELPDVARRHLARFVRKIGDLDFATTKNYDKRHEVIRYAELSDSARKCFEDGDTTNYGIKSDGASSSLHPEAVRINVQGQDFYIVDPRIMLARKVADIGSRFGVGKAKYSNDLEVMIDGFQEIYPREELLKVAHDDIIPSYPNQYRIPFYNPEFAGGIRLFFEDILKIDPNYNYLSSLKYGKERGIDVLSILSRINSHEAKQQVIDFFNDHRDLVDVWDISRASRSETGEGWMVSHITSMGMATDLLNNPDLMPEWFKSQIKGEITDQKVCDMIENDYRIFNWFSLYGGDVVFRKRPERSAIIETVYKLSKDNLLAEYFDLLKQVQPIDKEQFLLDIGGILGSDWLSDPQEKANLLPVIKKASQALSVDSFETFIESLARSLTRGEYYSREDKKFHNADSSYRSSMIRNLISSYGLQESDVNQ